MAAISGVLDTGLVQVGEAPIAMTTANYTLVQAEWENGVLTLSGAIGAGRDLILPAALPGALWTVVNGTTGGFAVTFKVSGQTGVAVAATKSAEVRCNATDIIRRTADV